MFIGMRLCSLSVVGIGSSQGLLCSVLSALTGRLVSGGWGGYHADWRGVAGVNELAATLKEPLLCREVFKTLFLFIIEMFVNLKSYKVEPAFIRCNTGTTTTQVSI